jgi:Ca2+-binding RTX toxin-like protein
MPQAVSNRPTTASLVPEITQSEDDGSILLGNWTGLPSTTYPGWPGRPNLIQANGTIGDGPYGSTSGDVDAFIVQGAANDVLTVDVDSLVFGGLDNAVAVYSSNGTLVGSIDSYDPNAEYDDFLHFTLPATDTYTVVISAWSTYLADPFDSSSGHADLGLTGDYRVFLNLTSAGNENILHGDNTANTITGTTFNDVIAGNGGADILNGGGGDDLFVWYATGNLDYYGNTVPSGNDAVDGGDGLDVQEVDGSNNSETFTLAPDGSGAVFTGTGISTGNVSLALANVEGLDVHGLGGNDTLTIASMAGSQLTGAITFWGDDGNDTLNAGAAGNVIIAHGGSGNDTFTGGSGDDHLFGDSGNDQLIGGAGNDVINGGTGDDRLWGNAGNDTFIGGAGADVFAGGGGFDTVDYSATVDGVHVDLTLNDASGPDAAGDTFNSIENLIGSAFGDTLTGNFAGNVLTGGAGNDTLDGREQNDTLSGGAGNDMLFGGTGDDLLFGDAGSDRLWGNDGDDTLYGGAGADAFAGGGGSDTLAYGDTFTAVSINLALHTSTGGDAAGDTFDSIENLTGGLGDDTLTGDDGVNVLDGGRFGHDTLDGGAGNDVLRGADGNDVLIGGLGQDILIGDQAGSSTWVDTFVFKTIDDSKLGAEDQIVDFSSAQFDQIDLAAIDANAGLAGDQAFSYVGTAGFTRTAGELRYANHLLQGDIDGNGTADFSIHINASTLAVTDFHL